jgi:hypothetical protein
MMNPSDQKGRPLEVGMRVRYIPKHARGTKDHADIEEGWVTSIGRQGYVHVRYDKRETPQATVPTDLVAVVGVTGAVVRQPA